MSDAFYKDMQGVVNDILPQFKQGTVVLRRFTKAADPSPSQVGEVTGFTDWVLAAAAPKEVPKKFINGTSIVEGDLMLVAAVRALSPAVDINPQMSDVLIIDGSQKTIKEIRPTPRIGSTPVNFQIFVQG